MTNQQASEVLAGKFVISNGDGTVWVADSATIYSFHEPEYAAIAKEWPKLTCKYPWVRGFGQKKVRFENLKKTDFKRADFSNGFGSASKSDPCNLHAKGIEKMSATEYAAL